jgi:hypothetical protein
MLMRFQGEEVEYVFGQPLRYTQNHTLAENELSRRVMQYFVRFAATGYDFERYSFFLHENRGLGNTKPLILL